MYRERASRVPGAVAWTATTDGTPSRILPDGCMDLIWMDDELVIAGPDTQPYVHARPAGERLTGIRFAPGYAPGLLGVPAVEFLNARVALEAVWPRAEVAAIVEQIAATNQPAAVLEAVTERAYATDASEAGAIAMIVRELRHGRSVAHIAEQSGISVRQLQRKSVHAFGYGPKMLARILRLVRALDLARTGTPFAEVAHAVGYADQAHLARDVNAFSGTTLRNLV